MKQIILSLINMPVRFLLIIVVAFLAWRGKEIPLVLEELLQRSVDLSDPLDAPTPLKK